MHTSKWVDYFRRFLQRTQKYRPTFQLRRHQGSSYHEKHLLKWEYNSTSLDRMWTNVFTIQFSCSPTVANSFGFLQNIVHSPSYMVVWGIHSLTQDHEPSSHEHKCTKTKYFFVQILLIYFCSFYNYGETIHIKIMKHSANNISLQPPQKMFSGGCSCKPRGKLFTSIKKIH